MLAAEFLLFQTMAARNHTWFYPRWYDQNQYLTDAYLGYEYYRAHGFGPAVWQTLSIVAPQGSLHALLGTLTFIVAGPSRSAALGLNMGAFLILQFATFQTVRKLSTSPGLAWMAVALLASLLAPWSGDSGSAVDFRLDWMAACAYGIALAAALSADGFKRTDRALVFGGAVGVTLLLRHLTAVYFVAIYTLLFAALLIQPDRWRKCRGLLLSGAVAAAMAGPTFWHSRHAIHDYYWLGHIDGPERALRSVSLGVLESVGWVMRELVMRQVGLTTLLIAGAAALLLWLAGRRPWTGTSPPETDPHADRMGQAWLITASFLLAPAAVLSLHTVKAPPPISIMAPALVWAAVLVLASLRHRVAAQGMAAISGGIVAVSAFVFARAVSAAPDPVVVRDAQKINALADYLHYRAEEAGLSRPRVAMTLVSDMLNADTLRVMGYERQRHWLTFEATLPTGLFESSTDLVMDRLAQSDFVCLVTATESAPWPFDRQLLALLPTMLPWCEANLRRVGSLRMNGVDMTVYERPGLNRPAAGLGGDFAGFMASATAGSPSIRPTPPSPPGLPTAPVAWSTTVDCDYLLAGIYTPLHFQVSHLPPGLELDSRSGRIRGRFSQPGRFQTELVATNSVGSVSAELAFVVSDQAAFVVMEPALTAKVGEPVIIRFSAFDAKALLNYIDVTDLSAGRMLARLTPGPNDQRSWQGAHQVTLPNPGTHHVLFRFVSYDARKKDPYTFFDQSCDITVHP